MQLSPYLFLRGSKVKDRIAMGEFARNDGVDGSEYCQGYSEEQHNDGNCIGTLLRSVEICAAYRYQPTAIMVLTGHRVCHEKEWYS